MSPVDIIICQHRLVARLRAVAEKRAQAEDRATTQRQAKKNRARASTEAAQELVRQMMADVHGLESEASKLVRLPSGIAVSELSNDSPSARLQGSFATMLDALRGVRDAKNALDELLLRPSQHMIALAIAAVFVILVLCVMCSR